MVGIDKYIFSIHLDGIDRVHRFYIELSKPGFFFSINISIESDYKRITNDVILILCRF